MTTIEDSRMREAFEKEYHLVDLSRREDGEYVRADVHNAWINFRQGHQAAIASLPRMTEGELRKLLEDSYVETPPDPYSSDTQYRALIAKFPHLITEK